MFALLIIIYWVFFCAIIIQRISRSLTYLSLAETVRRKNVKEQKQPHTICTEVIKIENKPLLAHDSWNNLEFG